MQRPGVLPYSASRRRESERRAALIVTVTFVVAGFAWVFLTDVVLYAVTKDPVLVGRIETAKGWTFILLSGLLVYAVTRRATARLTYAHATIAAIVDSIADGVLLLGPERTIIHANAAALQMLRCERLADLIGVGAPEFSRRFHLTYPGGALVPPARYASQRVFEEAGPLRYKAVLHPPGGQEVIISVTAAAVRTKLQGPADMVVSVMHDITDSEQLERMRDRFFAAAAHSLKTPVAIIKAHIQLLARAHEHVDRAIGPIERQCDRIDRLVQNLLVLARERSHTLELHPDDVDLAPLVEHVAHEMGRDWARHEVRADIRARPHVYADDERLAMALRNVVDEALRCAVAKSSVEVVVEEEDGAAAIGVRYRPSPFDERPCTGSEQDDDLAISRRVSSTIVEAHGGTMMQDHDEERTTAWIRLPMIDSPPAETSVGARR
ncbi:MAG: PAS domain-containing protein [Polyangiaceae bacterium]|nr:PAS domain-containing protein [Polyangiaceae bacterium]